MKRRTGEENWPIKTRGEVAKDPPPKDGGIAVFRIKRTDYEKNCKIKKKLAYTQITHHYDQIGNPIYVTKMEDDRSKEYI